MPDLVDRIYAEIRDRLAASRAAVQESERLTAALAALDRASPTNGEAGATPASSGRRTQRRRAPGSSRKRARRGANREAVLRVVGERPGITTSELAVATRVHKPTLYTLLSALTKQGALERQKLPGGQTGYRLGDADVRAA